MQINAQMAVPRLSEKLVFKLPCTMVSAMKVVMNAKDASKAAVLRAWVGMLVMILRNMGLLADIERDDHETAVAAFPTIGHNINEGHKYHITIGGLEIMDFRN